MNVVQNAPTVNLLHFGYQYCGESKRFYKLDVLCALKSLHKYCTKYLNCKLTTFWKSVLQIGCYVCIEKFAITLYKMPQL